ncbi:MAG: flavodoxin [Clostridia bacterium]|nr:flavodoxin [Clostridia bacterium]
MVIYFSGTGNSRYAAESIALQTKDKLVCANEYIKAEKTDDFFSDTPYVFVSPTYAWRLPRVFSAFIESGSFKGSNSAYFVMTCGDDIGNAGTYIGKLCEMKDLKLKGVSALVMPENYLAVYDVTEKSEAKLLMNEADKTLKALSDFIANGQDLPEVKTVVTDILKSSLINPVFYSLIVSAKGFHVTDKCISCGKCAEFCPLNNIKLEGGKPLYGKNCTHCMACICACPTEAIEYKKRTVGKERYYNSSSPEI